jgi:hypothetical protein
MNFATLAQSCVTFRYQKASPLLRDNDVAK